MAPSAFAPVVLPALLSIAPRSSQGAALTCQQGVLTHIQSHAHHKLSFNGQPVRAGPSLALLALFAPHFDDVPWQITQTSSLPEALGAPLAAASALSLALALNEWHGNPYSDKTLGRAVQRILSDSAFPILLTPPFRGGLHYSSGKRLITRALTPPELRTPIRLSIFGPNSSAPRRSPKSIRTLQSALFQFRKKPHLLTLAASSRQFALESSPSHWARHVLEPRPLAGVVAGSRILFELGISSTTPPVLFQNHPAPLTFGVQPSNLGARLF